MYGGRTWARHRTHVEVKGKPQAPLPSTLVERGSLLTATWVMSVQGFYGFHPSLLGFGWFELILPACVLHTKCFTYQVICSTVIFKDPRIREVERRGEEEERGKKGEVKPCSWPA